ncbi:MAG: hypothetical protein Q9N32_05320 [Gammaproteobacteria bacterium]|nr:hypothetical protein [Gammaproteobacteria bacterium]
MAKRTAQVNQLRGLLMEYGIVLPKGISHVRKRIPDILEEAENGLTPLFRELLNELYNEIVHCDKRITQLENKLKIYSQQNEDCKRLLTIP